MNKQGIRKLADSIDVATGALFIFGIPITSIYWFFAGDWRWLASTLVVMAVLMFWSIGLARQIARG